MQKKWLTIVKAKEIETAKQAPTPAQLAQVSAIQSSVPQSTDIQSP